jgi:hypothetical protein
MAYNPRMPKECLDRRTLVTTTIESNNHSMLKLTLAATTIIPSRYWQDIEQSPTSRIEPFASFAPWGKTIQSRATSPVSAQEMIAGLRKGGLPISAIAEAMRVETKSVYLWLNGGDMRSANTQRTAQLYRLFAGTVVGVDARTLYRFWNTPVVGQKTLRELTVADNIDEVTTAAALNKLRPAALRAMETERRMTRQGTGNAAIDDLPEAGANA